jgi:Bacterial dnaA protein helix-turn-helix
MRSPRGAGIARTAATGRFGRQLPSQAMYLAHVVLGLSLTEVGNQFARDRTTVAHACAMIEDMRDDPALDARLDHLERAVCSLVDALFAWRGQAMRRSKTPIGKRRGAPFERDTNCGASTRGRSKACVGRCW